MNGKAAQVIINVPARSINKPFTYMIPDHLDFLDVGWRVTAPFGGRNVEGFIIEIVDDFCSGEEIDEQQLKYITTALDEHRWFDRHMLEVARWISDYYLVSFAQALRLFIPGKKGVNFSKTYCINTELNLPDCMEKLAKKPKQYGLLLEYIHKNETASKSELKKILNSTISQIGKKEIQLGNIDNYLNYLVRHNYIYAKDNASLTGKPVYKNVFSLKIPRAKAFEALDEISGVLKKKPAQQKLIRELLSRNNNELDASELKKLNIAKSTAQNLAKIDLLEIKKVQIIRDSYLALDKSANTRPTLSSEQQIVLDALVLPLEAGCFKSFLLKGITGSGKTQVYIEAAAKARSLNRQVIVLVPEIALTSQIVRRFKAAFGDDVVVIHSKLSLGERNDAWQRLYSNQAGIVIGARSAVFAPAADLGLIILDEEHEFTYKQEETPRYHAKQVALKRAELSGATVIFGSATPSIETYYEAMSEKHIFLEMKNRINELSLPPVSIVDMRDEMAKGKRKVISEVMSDMLSETLLEKEQAIILLNRRGYSTFILCRECGHVLKCTHCDISLVYHMASGELKCHYCLERHNPPDICPACESRYIRYFGSGTQKAEEEIKLNFQAAKIVRMDQDTTGGKMGHDKILIAFAAGEYDILLGTQMVAKGHDVPNVTAVGVISADTALNLPDFRAAEKTFSLIMQAAGRAGRGEKPGKVVLQTYNPDHYAITSASKHDYEAFYKQEIIYRRELGYPPFFQLIKLTVQSEMESETISKSKTISEKLKKALPGLSETFIIGPFPAPMYKIKNIYSISIIIKTSHSEMPKVREAILLAGIFDMKEVVIDVDPLNVL